MLPGLVKAPHCSCMYGSDYVIPGCPMSGSSFGRGNSLSVQKIQELRCCNIQIPVPLNHLPIRHARTHARAHAPRGVEHMSPTLCMHRRKEIQLLNTLAAGNGMEANPVGPEKVTACNDASTSSRLRRKKPSEVLTFPPHCCCGYLQVFAVISRCCASVRNMSN